jgi:sugar phosphate isomerase/epimerase
VDRFAHAAIDRAARAGVGVIVFGSGGSRNVPDGWPPDRALAQLAAHLARWAPRAGDAGVTIAVEPLERAGCNIIHRVDEAVELVRRVDHPAVRVVADTFHMTRNGDPPDALRRAGRLIAHVHCAEREGRGPLGTVGEDQRPYFRALKDAGYDGTVSIEARWADLPAQLPAALAELRRQIDTA